ncbi:acid protease [Ganoderma leucocontextum]|nr:acid protease [Ganoderma leucocontextum]
MYALTWCSLLLVPVMPVALGASLVGADASFGIMLSLSRRDNIGVAIGVGVAANGTYSAPATVGNSDISFVISTRLGDFVAVSTSCQTQSCKDFNGTLYDASESFQPFDNTIVQLSYGADASSVIGQDSVTIGGLSIPDQTLAAINSFNRSDLFNGTAGILGLGFPLTGYTAAIFGASSLPSSVLGNLSTVSDTGVLEARDKNGTDPLDAIANILSLLYAHGPIVPSLFTYGNINEPLFSLTFDRNFSGSAGSGELTIGSLPTGVDSSSLTWAPVRLYDFGNASLPVNWEVEVDGVFLDGKALPGSSQVPKVSAVVDTTATATGGPKEAIDAILDAISATPVCNVSHTLSFQIGGRLFAVAPQDFVRLTGNGCGCTANVEDIDSLRSNWSLYSWRLGSSFMKSNLVAFDYGNLTHPSVEPPRMGFMSLEPGSNDARSSGVGAERRGWLALVSVVLVMML